MPPYAYNKLHAPYGIRVVELLPSRRTGATLRCRIHHTSIDPADQHRLGFAALSYVWGERFGSRPITCEDGTLLVTPNCEAALRRLRLAETSRYLWIDAICINQGRDGSAIRERNQQVKMMGEIYASATEVVIWLGEYPGMDQSTLNRSTLAAFVKPPSAMHTANQNDEGGLDDHARHLDAGAQLDEMKQLIFIDFDALDIDSVIDDPHAFEGISTEHDLLGFLRNPWFTRIWTIQELAFAQEAVVMMGRCRLPWDTFTRVWLRYAEYLHSSSMTEINGLTDWLHLCSGRSHVQTVIERGTGLNALNPWNPMAPYRVVNYLTLNRLCDHQASDPKDMIFGVQPILTRLGFRLPNPDYTKSTEQIYEETTRAIIRESKSLEIIIHSRPVPDGDFTLPSWVPNWSQTIGLQHTGDDHSWIEFASKAEQNLAGIELFINPFSTRHSLYRDVPCKQGQLVLTGYRLGEVIRRADYIFPRDKGTTVEYREVFSQWYRYMRNMSPPPKGINNEAKAEVEWGEWMRLLFNRDPRAIYKGTLGGPDIRHSKRYKVCLGDQRAFTLSSDLHGVGERGIRSGDVVVLVHGADYPLILRPSRDRFLSRGCVYVWGAMVGQMWPERELSARSMMGKMSRKHLLPVDERGTDSGSNGVGGIVGRLARYLFAKPKISRAMELERFVIV